jgi:integrase
LSIYKRKSGRYAVVIAAVEGSTQRRSLGTYGTRKEAEKAQREALTARDRGHSIAAKKITVAEMMTEFLEHCRNEPERHTAATIETYTLKSKRYIEPKLGSLLLSKLSVAAVAEWKNGLRATIGRSGKFLSLKTVHNAFGLLHAALSMAVGLEYVGRNVCDVKAAKPARPATGAHAGKALSDDEIRRLLKTAGSTRWHSFIVLALATGARRGELCGLSWTDVDLDGAGLRIRHSLSQTKGCVELKDTKTHRGRNVGLSAWALHALRRQRAIQAEERRRAPAGLYIESGAIFTNELGERITPMSATKAFRRIAQAAELSTKRLHDTRHTAASHLIGDGVDVRTVAGVLGHESANITLSVYSHLLEDATKKATDRLGERMEQIATGQMETTATVLQLRRPVKEKNARKNERSMVEARRLELLTLTLPA